MEHSWRKIQTLLIDDLDASQFEDTARSSLDGAEYEIGLNAERARACEVGWCAMRVRFGAGPVPVGKREADWAPGG